MRMKQSRIASLILLLVGVLLAFPLVAGAVGLPTGLNISGEYSLVLDPDVDVTVIGSINGDYSVKVGGADTQNLFDATGLTAGSDPLVSGLLTETGDGFGANVSVAVGNASDFAFGLDLALALTNTTAETYQVTFAVDYSNSVNSSGEQADGAYAETEFVLLDAGLNELFASYLLSDSLNADGLQQDVGLFSETLTLNPGDTIDLTGLWSFWGGVFENGGSSLIDFRSFISIESFASLDAPPIPEPGTFLLFGAGLAGFAVYARKRRNNP